MKREILFRGKSPKGHWIYGMPSYDLKYIFNDSNYDSYEQFEVIPETIGQFTGLVDKNGVKIFEGGILKFEDGQIADVEWEPGGPIVYANFGDYNITTVGWAIECLGGCEVIGNIHDK